MKKQTGFSFGKLLLILAATVQGVQYVYAFTATHAGGDLPGLAIGGGVVAGFVVLGSVAWAGGRLPLIRAKAARVAAWAAFLILLTVSPLILTPINWYQMAAGLRAAIGWYSWALAALVASVPELAIALVAFADKGLLPAGQPANSTGQPARRTGRPAKSAGQPAKVYSCTLPGCKWTTTQSEAVKRGGNPQAALAAHISHHKREARQAQPQPGQLAEVLFKGGEQ